PAVGAVLQELGNCAGGKTLVGEMRPPARRLAEGGGARALGGFERPPAPAATGGHDPPRPTDATPLTDGPEVWGPRAARRALLTLHAAKGLEFPVAFIVGLEDGVMPLHWHEPDEAAIAEERRLFYVGMTRAKDRLILSHARQRLWRGRLRML